MNHARILCNLIKCRAHSGVAHSSSYKKFSKSSLPAKILTNQVIEHNLSCQSCGSELHCCALFCGSNDCKKVQKLNIARCNFFELFGMETPKYQINTEQIEQKYRNLQKQMHPDKFATYSNDEKLISIENSSLINQAISTLKSPIDRANYLVCTFHIPITSVN
jgi:hypothetical protein